MIDIVEWAQSPMGFYVDRQWTGHRWQLGASPIKLASYHADILRHCFTPGADGRLPYDVIAWCEPAKSGKSAVVALAAEYMALHGERNSSVVMASNKQNQAATVMFKSLTDSIQMNPHLPNVDPGRYEVAFSNGNMVAAIPSNSRGEAGARFSLAVFDELWGYVHTDAQRLWSEFKTDPTRLNSVKLATGYAGYLESELWLEVLQQGMAGEPVAELAHITNDGGDPACWRNGRQFTFWSHRCRQPWQTEGWLESQRKALRPAEYRRMILTEFVEGMGDFVDQAAWEACIDPGHRRLEPGSRQYLYVGLDVATKAGGDDCACIAVYQEGQQVKLAWHKVWHGGLRRWRDLRLSDTVQPFLAKMATEYRIAGVYFDPYQALKLADDLGSVVRCIEVPQTHATRGPKDTALFEMIVTGELVLYDDPEIRQAVAHANAKELGNGLVFLQKRGRGKIDLLVALANCADEARWKRVGQVQILPPIYDDGSGGMTLHEWVAAGKPSHWWEVAPDGSPLHSPAYYKSRDRKRQRDCEKAGGPPMGCPNCYWRMRKCPDASYDAYPGMIHHRTGVIVSR